jgi:hypothetical protein
LLVPCGLEGDTLACGGKSCRLAIAAVPIPESDTADVLREVVVVVVEEDGDAIKCLTCVD